MRLGKLLNQRQISIIIFPEICCGNALTPYVWLDRPRRTVTWQVVRRSLTRVIHAPDTVEKQRENSIPLGH